MRFESIHPFQDGNSRVGRLIIFKECLKYNIVPFIIEDASSADSFLLTALLEVGGTARNAVTIDVFRLFRLRQVFATMLSDDFKNGQKIAPLLKGEGLYHLYNTYFVALITRLAKQSKA